MRLAYCTTCSPAKLLAVTTSNRSTPKGLVADKKPPQNMPSHFEDGKMHVGQFVTVRDTPTNPGEDPGDYIKRIAKKFKAKMK